MTEWYEKGYPGGKMVEVKGFPRAVYPPDAASKGKTPSEDGPDILAYKRTVSRAGRWPWDKFDDSYSNNFAHGKAGGNVGDSGVAGVQRQLNLDDTGWIGENTFNGLRSIRIPEGLPHAGEPAMDATAVNQINQAYDLFRNQKPPQDDKISLGSIGEGPSVREYDLTHATAGIPYYPAFDACWYVDKNVLAPEDLNVTRTGTASHGVAFYADGKSGLRWWFGHLQSVPSIGKVFKRGDVIGKVAYSPDNSPHVHVGINVERLWGSGKQMTHHTNYTHGAPMIGKQLDAGHAL